MLPVSSICSPMSIMDYGFGRIYPQLSWIFSFLFLPVFMLTWQKKLYSFLRVIYEKWTYSFLIWQAILLLSVYFFLSNKFQCILPLATCACRLKCITVKKILVSKMKIKRCSFFPLPLPISPKCFWLLDLVFNFLSHFPYSFCLIWVGGSKKRGRKKWWVFTLKKK